jgi:hypothetical protein
MNSFVRNAGLRVGLLFAVGSLGASLGCSSGLPDASGDAGSDAMTPPGDATTDANPPPPGHPDAGPDGADAGDAGDSGDAAETSCGDACAPSDSCATNNGGCSAHAACTSTGPGTRTCACAAGYAGDGITCTAINACVTNNGQCDPNATCTSTGPGTDTCTCNTGYTGNGATCTGVNACATNNGGCAPTAKCTSTGPNTVTCACNTGYSGDGHTCTPINACLTKNGGCDAHATCADTGPGTVTCTCNTGYTGSGTTCAAVNSCQTGNGGCDTHATCTSTGPGTNTCACNAGYTGDGKTCAAVQPTALCVGHSGWTGSGWASKDLAVVKGAAYWTISPFIATCPLTANNTTPTQFDSISGGGMVDVGADPIRGVLYESMYNQPLVTQKPSYYLDQYAAPSNSATQATNPSPGNWTGAFKVDATSGYVFAPTTSGVRFSVPAVPDGDGGLPSSVPCVPTTDAIGPMAAGGGRVVYFDTVTGKLMSAEVLSPTSCSAPATVASSLSNVGGIATGGDWVVFAANGNVYSCSSVSGCGQSLSPIAQSEGSVPSIALDGNGASGTAYWVGANGLVRCAATGCGGKPTVLTNTALPTSGLAVDGSNVYYLQDTTLFSLPK